MWIGSEGMTQIERTNKQTHFPNEKAYVPYGNESHPKGNKFSKKDLVTLPS